MAWSPLFTQALITGAVLSIFCYHLAMCVTHPTRSLGYYLGYTFCLLGLVFIHAQNPLWALADEVPEPREWSFALIEAVVGAGVPIFYILTCVALIHADGWHPGLRRWLVRFVFLFVGDLGLALLTLGVWGQAFQPWSQVPLALISLVRLVIICAATGLFLYAIGQYLRAKDWGRRWLGASSLFLVIGGLVFSLSDYGIHLLGNATRSYYFFEITCLVQLMTFGLVMSEQRRSVEEQRRRLQVQDELKSRVFANVSHEFRTPLTLILAPLRDWLAEQPAPRDQQRLRHIERQAQRLLRLINQILDLAKLEAGHLHPAKQPGDLAAFVRQLCAHFESLAHSRAIDLQCEAGPPTLGLAFDPDHWEKILSNLLHNALKYTPEQGKVQVRLSLDGAGQQVHLSVADTGPGIDPLLLPHLFERFTQAEARSDLPSTGIGLALTWELVQLHGGGIEVQSHPGQGSTFVVTLPYHPVEVPPEPPKPTAPDATLLPAEQPTPEPPDYQPKPALLLVEDNPEMRGYLRRVLQADFALSEATDGQQGLEQAIAEVPDLVLTDLMMPQQDGFQLTRALKGHELTSHIPVLILTGKASADSRQQGWAVDADEYLTKPFDPPELRARLHNLLRNRQRLQAYYRKQGFAPADATPLPSQEQAFMQKVLAVVETELANEHFTVQALADSLALSRTQLYRKLDAITGQDPQRFIRSYRLRQAHRLLAAETATVAEIAYQVGFKDPSYFSRCFKQAFGYAPSRVRGR